MLVMTVVDFATLGKDLPLGALSLPLAELAGGGAAAGEGWFGLALGGAEAGALRLAWLLLAPPFAPPKQRVAAPSPSALLLRHHATPFRAADAAQLPPTPRWPGPAGRPLLRTPATPRGVAAAAALSTSPATVGRPGRRRPAASPRAGVAAAEGAAAAGALVDAHGFVWPVRAPRHAWAEGGALAVAP